MTHSAAGEQPGPSPTALSLTLAEALVTRLCHDLAGGLGTVLGALELAGDDPALANEALPLASDAAAQLGHRLHFVRAAWGGAGETLDTAGLQALAAGLPTGRRVRVLLDGLAPGRRFAPPAARVLLNLLLLGVESVAGDGLVALSGTAAGDVVLTIQGPRAAWPAGLVSQFADADAALVAATTQGARLLQGPLVALIAHAAGIRVTLLLGPCAHAAPPIVVSAI